MTLQTICPQFYSHNSSDRVGYAGDYECDSDFVIILTVSRGRQTFRTTALTKALTSRKSATKATLATFYMLLTIELDQVGFILLRCCFLCLCKRMIMFICTLFSGLSYKRDLYHNETI